MTFGQRSKIVRTIPWTSIRLFFFGFRKPSVAFDTFDLWWSLQLRQCNVLRPAMRTQCALLGDLPVRADCSHTRLRISLAGRFNRSGNLTSRIVALGGQYVFAGDHGVVSGTGGGVKSAITSATSTCTHSACSREVVRCWI